MVEQIIGKMLGLLALLSYFGVFIFCLFHYPSCAFFDCKGCDKCRDLDSNWQPKNSVK